MNLQLLDFDRSEDAEGVVCWDALAQPARVHNTALLDEVTEVLRWCHHFDAHGPGPLEDGANWDFDLQLTLYGDTHHAQPARSAVVQFDAATGTVQIPPGADQQAMALSLSISGTPAFGEAFGEQFGL